MAKTILSFYCDDTNPYVVPPSAFKHFLDFASSEGIAGEASVILGYEWAEQGLLSRPANEIQNAFVEQVRRACACGIDSHCELMTHAGLFDFKAGRIPEGISHEGVWLYEPTVTVDEYAAYFGSILADGEKAGIRFTGVTWPGCNCDACTRRYAELRTQNILDPNPNFWLALLNLAKDNRFRGHTIPCFFGGAVEACQDQLMAREGIHAVYALPPNAEDHFGIWLNAPEYVSADYYISADGRFGRIVELVHAQAPYGLFYAHWQGLNPANGVGWEAFTQVIGRVQKYLGDRVVWMRPSQLTDYLLSQNA
jgi:hypothetical protein